MGSLSGLKDGGGQFAGDLLHAVTEARTDRVEPSSTPSFLR